MTPDDLVAKFAAAFRGRDDAYGRLANGKNLAERKPVSERTFRDHLEGRLAIGIYPLLNDGTVHWICWDFDRPNPRLSQAEVDQLALLDAMRVMEQLYDLGFNRGLYLELSKSKGAHLWGFFERPVNAALARRLGTHVCALAGVDKPEFFPKQDHVTLPDGLGNYVNLPFFNGLNETPERRVIVDPEWHRPVSLEAWLADFTPLSALAFEEISAHLPEQAYDPAMAAVMSGKVNTSEGFPCTPDMLKTPQQVGTRNNFAYALSIRLHQQYGEDTGLQFLQIWNASNQPPSDDAELKRTFRSAKNAGNFWCDHELVKPFCKESCPLFGHKTAITRLRKLDTRPAIYYVSVQGQDVRLSVNELMSFTALARESIEQVNVAPPPMKQNRWYEQVQRLLETVEIIPAPYEASEIGLAEELILTWVYDDAGFEDERDEILRGRKHVHGDRIVFKGIAIRNFITNRLGPSAPRQNELWDILRRNGGKEERMKVAKKTTHVWTMPRERNRDEEEEGDAL